MTAEQRQSDAPQLTLGIETSGMGGSIALRTEHELLAERSLRREGRRHAQTLVMEIRQLFDELRLPVHTCRRVGVSIGPGSFTGLRVGVVCAQTLAYATGCLLMPVETFHAVALRAPSDVERALVIANAQRGDLFVAAFRQAEGEWRREGEYTIAEAERWCRARATGDFVTGPGLSAFADLLPNPVRRVPAADCTPTAAAIAELAALAAPSRAAPISSLEPLYIRRSAAEEKWEAN
jgi:tRNA threonylcarbamoyladenosine biosynthesis protein TsaB